ncbi:MAG: phage tail tape measure protein [Ruminococcus sp.]|nr:phage tail tape measure protein [Ruminococcus sp.]
MAGSAVSELGNFSVSVGKDFEAGMSQVAATLGYSAEALKKPFAEMSSEEKQAYKNMENLSAKAKEMGASTSFSASQASEGLNILAMSGYSAEDSIGMIENVLHLAEAGSLSLADAASFAAGSMKGFVSEAGNFADVTEASAYYSDLIAKGATLAATDVSQLGTALSQASATADSYGQSSTEAGVALLRLAEQNITGSNAATALAAAMKDLYSPTDTAKKALESLGVSAYDSSGKARDFNTVVDELNGALSSLTDEERASLEDTIFGIQGKAAFDKMIASSGDTVRKFYDGIADASGSAALQSETMLDNLEGKMTIFQSASEGFGIAIYESFNEPLKDLVGTATGYIEQLTKAFNEGGFEGLAGTFGDVLADAVNVVADYIPKITETAVSVVSALADGLKENSPEIIRVGMSVGKSLIDGILSISADLSALAYDLFFTLAEGLAEHISDIAETGLSIVSTFSDSVLGSLPELLDLGLLIIKSVANAVLENLPQLVVVASEIVGKLADFLAEGVPQVLEAAKHLLMGIVDALPQVITALAQQLPLLIDTVLQLIPQLADSLAEIFPEIIACLVGGLPTVVEAIAEALPEIFSMLIETILSFDTQLLDTAISLFSALVDALPVVLEALLEQIPTIITAVVDTLVQAVPQLTQASLTLFMELVKAIPTILAEIVNGLAQLWETSAEWLGEILSAGWEIVGQWLADMLENLKTGASEMVAGVMEFIDELPEKIGTALGFVIGTVVRWVVEFPEKAKEAASKFVENIRNFFSELPEKVGNFLKQALEKVTGWGSDLKEKGKKIASDLVSKITDGITSLPSKMAEAGKNLVQGLWNGVTNAGNWLKDKISGFGNGIINGFKRAFGIHSPSTVMRDSVGKYLAQGIGVGFDDEIPDVAVSALKAFENVAVAVPDVKIPDLKISGVSHENVDISAIKSLENQSVNLSGGLVRPSATSEIVNNTYNYGSPSVNTENVGNPHNIVINARFMVDGETVAEGVTDIIADKIDELQGVKIQLRKRGLAR